MRLPHHPLDLLLVRSIRIGDLHEFLHCPQVLCEGLSGSLRSFGQFPAHSWKALPGATGATDRTVPSVSFSVRPVAFRYRWIASKKSVALRARSLCPLYSGTGIRMRAFGGGHSLCMLCKGRANAATNAVDSRDISMLCGIDTTDDTVGVSWLSAAVISANPERGRSCSACVVATSAKGIKSAAYSPAGTTARAASLDVRDATQDAGVQFSVTLDFQPRIAPGGLSLLGHNHSSSPVYHSVGGPVSWWPGTLLKDPVAPEAATKPKSTQSAVRTIANVISKPKDPTPPEAERVVIYQVQCKECDASYIGETERKRKTRLKEHAQDVANSTNATRFKSELVDHAWTSGHQFDFDKARDKRRGLRKLLESWFIQNDKCGSDSSLVNKNRGPLPDVYTNFMPK
ncbi:GIY-YIG nuclease family protein [Ixodes scapularis]